MRFSKNLSITQLIEFCGPLVSSSAGPKEASVLNFQTPDSPEPGGFSFILSPKMLAAVEKSGAVCVLAPEKCKEAVTALNSKKAWLFSPNPELAARNIKNAFVLSTPYRDEATGVHPTATIDSTAQIAKGVSIGPHAVVGKNCRIGEGSFVGANAVIEANVIIKDHVTIHPQAYIGHSCEIGHHCEIMPQAIVGSEGFGYAHDHLGNHYRVPHSGRVILEDDVHVGAGTAIDRGTIEDTVIGQGTKLDNQCHFAHNLVVGKNGLFTAQFVAAGSTTIGDNFMCGGKTGVTGHITITDNVHVAGLSGITGNVTEPGQYGGYPLIPLKKHLKAKASEIHLPELRRQMAKVLRKLFPEDYQ